MTATTAHAFLPYSVPPLIRIWLLSTETADLSSHSLHLKITVQTEIHNDPWSRKEKVKLCRHMDLSRAMRITENGCYRLLYLIRQTIRRN